MNYQYNDQLKLIHLYLWIYNVYIYKQGGDTIVSSMSNIISGFRKIPELGNAQLDTIWVGYDAGSRSSSNPYGIGVGGVWDFDSGTAGTDSTQFWRFYLAGQLQCHLKPRLDTCLVTNCEKTPILPYYYSFGASSDYQLFAASTTRRTGHPSDAGSNPGPRNWS